MKAFCRPIPDVRSMRFKVMRARISCMVTPRFARNLEHIASLNFDVMTGAVKLVCPRNSCLPWT